MAHQYSGALAASLLADLGADVIAVEHPTRDAIRTMLPRKGEHSMWWKVVQRGKRMVSIDISTPEGRDVILALAREADVITENFRPGTLERWKLGPRDLEEAGISVVMLRISGFGQSGPRSERPGFGTVAEAMSGFANLNGEPDGPPIFPSTTLADGVAAIFGAFGAMAAMWSREHAGTRPGIEVVDMALFEGLFRIIPTQIAGFHQLGEVPTRPGNKLTSHGVLRDLYQSRDGHWFIISAVGPVPIRRVVAAARLDALVARLDAGVMADDPAEVIAFLDECNEGIHTWARARSWNELVDDLTSGDVVYQQVYAANDIVDDAHYQARGDLIEVPDDDLGPILMQGVVPKFPSRVHSVWRAGPKRGIDNEEILQGMLGLSDSELAKLRDNGII